MKKVLVFLVTLILIFGLVGCTQTNELPKGKVKRIDVICDWNNDMSRTFAGGEFEYINETTIKYIDDEGNLYYLSTSTISFLLVDEE